MPHFQKNNHLCKLPSKTNIAISVFILCTPVSLPHPIHLPTPICSPHPWSESSLFFARGHWKSAANWPQQQLKKKKGGVGKFSGATNVFVERSPNLKHVENLNINWHPLVCPSGPFHLTFLFMCCGLRTWGSSDPDPPPPPPTKQ